ncbi:MAG: Na+/H+ antiporter subunit E [Erysipelotrichaceae bacterium]|nr:Na+/H+ antiporter subunit E [Solobacterium sp.]MDY2731447.1 Na+/H+ antiporter subunit E [Erysipelotrichaceae bacterium]MCI7732646.1 Na+/H+ antiporter subunit E [Solobacterium sp.]MDD6955354.1 Na+/H+ antiporter subunit E [Solobacterium sp.]MDY4640616.1 Na+/H+ antiporter subunit E [Erysipelotrichaceae bacterium]
MYLLLFLFWLILMGRVTTEIVIFGIGLTVLIGIMIYVLFDYTPKKEISYLIRVPLFVVYIFVLIREIIIANINVMQVITNKEIKIEPTLVTFRSGLRTGFGRFMLANSITLTPGTISVNVKGDVFTVHCLSTAFLDVSESSPFITYIKKLEGE